MIIDSHCHAWRYWPYEPPAPDPTSRGTVEQLLWEMDQHGVDKAVLVCARIEHNPDDNEYVAACLQRFPDRLYQFADVDCYWWPTYQTPGAAARLARAVQTFALRGFTHYVAKTDSGEWYLSDEGLQFWRTAADLNQIASLAIPARLLPVLGEVARRFPSLTFLCHHMAGARLDRNGQGGPDLDAIRRAADLPNIHVKLSGFHYVWPEQWAFPYPGCEPVVRLLLDHYGPERLHWGSDYPVVRKAMTFQHSLEAVRTHCAAIIPAAAMPRILGDSLYELLQRHGMG